MVPLDLISDCHVFRSGIGRMDSIPDWQGLVFAGDNDSWVREEGIAGGELGHVLHHIRMAVRNVPSNQVHCFPSNCKSSGSAEPRQLLGRGIAEEQVHWFPSDCKSSGSAEPRQLLGRCIAVVWWWLQCLQIVSRLCSTAIRCFQLAYIGQVSCDREKGNLPQAGLVSTRATRIGRHGSHGIE